MPNERLRVALHERIAGGQLFDYYMASFERVWESGASMAVDGAQRAVAV